MQRNLPVGETGELERLLVEYIGRLEFKEALVMKTDRR
jgi:hypothetical protein